MDKGSANIEVVLRGEGLEEVLLEDAPHDRELARLALPVVALRGVEVGEVHRLARIDGMNYHRVDHRRCWFEADAHI